jgi:hypothetical protein
MKCIVVKSFPRTGSSEFCRQLATRLSEQNNNTYIQLGEFLSHKDRNSFGDCASALEHFEKLPDTPTKVLAPKFVGLDESGPVYEPAIRPFKNKNELQSYIDVEKESRLNFLNSPTSIKLVPVIKDFFNISLNETTEVFYYRRNIKDMLFSLAFKRHYAEQFFEKKVLTHRLDRVMLEHNMSGKQSLLKPIERVLIENVESMVQYQFLKFQQYSRKSFNTVPIVSYEDFFFGKPTIVTIDGITMELVGKNFIEQKMNYATGDQYLYFENYQELLDITDQYFSQLGPDFVERFKLTWS